MNKYIVYGRRSVDMCGNYNDVELGVIELEEREEILKLARPVVGHHIYNGNFYSDILFFKTKTLSIDNLLTFHNNKNGVSNLKPLLHKIK